MKDLSQAGVEAVHAAVASHVDRGVVPGAVAVINRGEQSEVVVVGKRAIDGAPMRRDTLFRITSMTKPIVAVAALILVEEGRLDLDEPVDRLLPELANRMVLRRPDGPLDDLVPASRPVTVRDLLTLQMGFGIVMAVPDTIPIQRAVAERDLALGPPKPATPHGPDEWLRRFAELPLQYQPGQRWLYDTGLAVLGVLIARAAGQTLGEYLQRSLFAPLGMNDTGFSVPGGKLDRLATCYEPHPETTGLAVHDGVQDSQWRRPPAFESATGGLISTVDDYLAFARMMLGRGEVDGRRIVSEASVDLMTTDHLSAGVKAASDHVGMILDGQGWGFGVSVTDTGRYGWYGGYGTSWYNDPASGGIGILLAQRLFDVEVHAMSTDFWRSVDTAAAQG